MNIWAKTTDPWTATFGLFGLLIVAVLLASAGISSLRTALAKRRRARIRRADVQAHVKDILTRHPNR
jgi:hypothetical protein